MRLESHENLTLLSIRHDLFGPGRFHPAIAHPNRALHAHHLHHLRLQVHPKPHVEVRVVESASPPQPADCPPCHVTDPSQIHPRHTPTPATAGTAWPYIATARPTDTRSIPAPFPMAQDFVYGQPVPATGGLLDIMA